MSYVIETKLDFDTCLYLRNNLTERLKTLNKELYEALSYKNMKNYLLKDDIFTPERVGMFTEVFATNLFDVLSENILADSTGNIIKDDKLTERLIIIASGIGRGMGSFYRVLEAIKIIRFLKNTSDKSFKRFYDAFTINLENFFYPNICHKIALKEDITEGDYDYLISLAREDVFKCSIPYKKDVDCLTFYMQFNKIKLFLLVIIIDLFLQTPFTEKKVCELIDLIQSSPKNIQSHDVTAQLDRNTILMPTILNNSPDVLTLAIERFETVTVKYNKNKLKCVTNLKNGLKRHLLDISV